MLSLVTATAADMAATAAASWDEAMVGDGKKGAWGDSRTSPKCDRPARGGGREFSPVRRRRSREELKRRSERCDVQRVKTGAGCMEMLLSIVECATGPWHVQGEPFRSTPLTLKGKVSKLK